MTGLCPILFENKQEEYELTDKEVAKFCQEGCSVDCDILLKQYAERLNKRKGKTMKNYVEDMDIIVEIINGKLYYSIKYKKVGDNDYTIGYSSYNLDFVFEWKEKYFELIEKKADEVVKKPTWYSKVLGDFMKGVGK